MLNKTYNIEKGPAPVDEKVHQIATNQKFKELLAASPSEKDMQAFLERHPALVPGSRTPGNSSGHYPLHCALITQPKLQGLTTRIPDFMWISTHSAGWFPTLIEIESPEKKLFTKAGHPTRHFTQARSQLEQWKTWFSNSTNVQTFIEMYRVPEYMKSGRQMQLHMILVYGRREEFESNYTLSKERHSLNVPGMEIMSFDRLSYERDLNQAITVRMRKDNRYEAIYVPPTFTLGPNLSDRLTSVIGIEVAIENNDEIASDRKSFLRRRIPYWENWQNSGAKGVQDLSDYE
jgi:hypothetical protein